ncbi:hypothetical protein V1511DRAFT_486497 [Dipodascopsis uninucleata]
MYDTVNCSENSKAVRQPVLEVCRSFNLTDNGTAESYLFPKQDNCIQAMPALRSVVSDSEEEELFYYESASDCGNSQIVSVSQSEISDSEGHTRSQYSSILNSQMRKMNSLGKGEKIIKFTQIEYEASSLNDRSTLDGSRKHSTDLDRFKTVIEIPPNNIEKPKFGLIDFVPSSHDSESPSLIIYDADDSLSLDEDASEMHNTWSENRIQPSEDNASIASVGVYANKDGSDDKSSQGSQEPQVEEDHGQLSGTFLPSSQKYMVELYTPRHRRQLLSTDRILGDHECSSQTSYTGRYLGQLQRFDENNDEYEYEDFGDNDDDDFELQDLRNHYPSLSSDSLFRTLPLPPEIEEDSLDQSI